MSTQLPVAQRSLYSCGRLVIKETDRLEFIAHGETARRQHTSGKYKIFEVLGEGLFIEVAHAVWDNGDMDVRAVRVEGGTRALRRLEHSSLRLGIRELEDDYSCVELRQARVKANDPSQWSSVRQATKEQLDEGSGLDVFHILRDAGARDIGIKEQILLASDKTKNRLCAIFEADNRILPVVAFVITRVLPLLNEYQA